MPPECVNRQTNQDIENFVLNAGADFVGFARIENQNSPAESLNTAISLGIVYKPSSTHLSVNELHPCIAGTKAKMASVLESAAQYLHERGCKTWAPQIFPSSKEPSQPEGEHALPNARLSNYIDL